MTYLEKFAKYQNDFMMREIKNFQDDFHKYQSEAYERLRESERLRDQNVELAKKLDSHSDELEILKEMMKMKDEEMELFDKERKNYLLALENIRKDGYNLGSLKKENDNLVAFFLANLVEKSAYSLQGFGPQAERDSQRERVAAVRT